MKNEENPFIENGLYENITMVISESFFSVLDKVISGYCPYAKVDTFFISEKEALHCSWSNGWEAGCCRVDLTGKTTDFIEHSEEPEPVGNISVDNLLVLLNGIVRKWERYESDEQPAGVICDVQFIGKINEHNAFIVPIGYKDQWENTVMISYLFSSFAAEWFVYLPKIEKIIKKSKTMKDADKIIDADNVVKRACNQRLNEIFQEGTTSEDLYNVITRLAIQSYESKSNRGTLASIDDIELEKTDVIKFSKPIPINDGAIRQIRKILEIASNGWDILVNNKRIVGMGKAISNKGKVCFKKPGCWNVMNNGEILFSVEGNKFSIVVSPEDVPYHDKFMECFGKSGKWETVGKIIKDAQEQHHGTTILVSDAAKDEAKRLCKLGYGILVSPFSGESINGAIKASTAIDGAILVDRKGVCYAIGVILDGTAQIPGNPARGARYNSVRNYLASPLYAYNGTNAMAIIVSEDGSTDVITSVEIKKDNPGIIGNG